MKLRCAESAHQMYVTKVGASCCSGEMVCGATGREFDYSNGMCAHFFFWCKKIINIKLTP